MAACHRWLVHILLWQLLAAVPGAFRELHYTGEREGAVMAQGRQVQAQLQ
jgi:hypothetical protein